jgi:hypothetical protein
MAEKPNYVILGRGRWAGRMQTILGAEGRGVTNIPEARRAFGEGDSAYISRLAAGMSTSGAQIAWLCVLPGPHVALMIEAALEAGLHIVVEKPWQGTQRVTEALAARAKSLHRVIAVHFEYCLLDEVQRWRRDFHPGKGLRFGGHFLLSRPDHMGISAMENLGSHLLAIREYAAAESDLQEIRCGYEQPDERSVWLEKRNTRVAFLNLLESKEPIIQRFAGKMEESLETGDFPFDLEFALRVAKGIAALG